MTWVEIKAGSKEESNAIWFFVASAMAWERSSCLVHICSPQGFWRGCSGPYWAPPPRSHSGLAADPTPLGSGCGLFDKFPPPRVPYDSDLIPTLTLWCTGSEFTLHFTQGRYRYLVKGMYLQQVCIYSVETVCIFGKLEIVVWFLQRSVGRPLRSLHLCCSFTPQILAASTCCGSVFGVIGPFISLCSLMKSEKGQKEGQASW